MKMPASYTDYLRLIECYHLDEHAEALLSNPLVQEQIVRLNSGFSNLMPALYVLDLTRRKYLFVNAQMQQVTGYYNEAMLEGGTDFGLTLWNKHDLKIFSKHIFLDNLRVLQSIGMGGHNRLSFECNYRITARNGERKNLLQQSVYIASSADGMPLVSMGILTDISRLRNDSRIFHAITEHGAVGTFNRPKVLLAEQYFAEEKLQQLSAREVELLKWICEGLESKAIASKLSISINTVNNHRRHIIAKTGCKTTIALYRYAINHGYL